MTAVRQNDQIYARSSLSFRFVFKSLRPMIRAGFPPAITFTFFRFKFQIFPLVTLCINIFRLRARHTRLKRGLEKKMGLCRYRVRSHGAIPRIKGANGGNS